MEAGTPPKKVTQRAARKAAAACLARQRHKSFVTSLQDQVSARQDRVNVLREWHDETFAACTTSMVGSMAAHLTAPQLAQLQRWLLRSPKLHAALTGQRQSHDREEGGERAPAAAADGASSKAPAPSAAGAKHTAKDAEGARDSKKVRCDARFPPSCTPRRSAPAPTAALSPPLR